MENYKELKNKIEAIIKKVQMPQDIKTTIKGYLEEYESVCDEYTKKLRLIEDSEAIYILKKYIDKDYEEDYETINSTIDVAYTIKQDTLLNELMKKLEYIKENKEKNSAYEIINNPQNNEIFINTVKSEIVSELISSKKNILQRTSTQTMTINNMEKRYYIERAKETFEEDINAIIQKIERNFPEMTRLLNKEDIQVYDLVLETIEEYRMENQDLEENSFEEKRKNFIEETREGVNVDEKTAQEKIENQREENKKIQTLDENVIS